MSDPAAPPAAEISSLLRALAQRLGSRLEAELLLGAVLDVERAWLYAHGNEPLSIELQQQLASLAARRQAGEPMAYLLGRREFYGRDFTVNSAVLIPRPETELLVETALEKLGERATVLDLGTGSGCIALSLAAERPAWKVTASDLSEAALAVARANASRLRLDQVELLHGDLFGPVSGRRFDAILSNPPYVAVGDPHLSRGDLRFEPAMALSADQDGLFLIERLIRDAGAHLHAGGWLLIEHGYDQGPSVRERLARAGFEQIETRCDLGQIERLSLGCRSASAV
ncbi:MAG: peptide chain release factor N(5)-glutamine methyltransferase [Wenzhouxiangella sp.]